MTDDIVWLTSADPEPEPYTTVETQAGERWTRHADMAPGSWLMNRLDLDGDPQTWRQVAGEFGPVRLIGPAGFDGLESVMA